MASASQLVLNDLLCFLANKFGRIPLQTLKTILTDFYHVDVISEAKVRLLEDIKDMNLSSNLPHIPYRRTGEAKLLHEAEDILSLLTFADEAKALDKLPQYVAASPDNMPSCRLYEGDMNVILNIMKDINRRVGEVELSLVTFGRQVTQLTQVRERVQQAELQVGAPGWPTLRESAQAGARAGQQTVSVSAASGNSVLPSTEAVRTDHSSVYPSKDGSSGMRVEAASDWATLSSTPRVQSGRFTVLSSLTDDDEGQQNAFTTVVSRRNSKRRRPHQSNAGVSDSTQPGVQPGVQSTSAQASQQRRRAPLLHGRSNNGSGSLWYISSGNNQKEVRLLCRQCSHVLLS